MSRVDHIIRRHREEERPRRLIKRYGHNLFDLTAPKHEQGDRWWRGKMTALHKSRQAPTPTPE